MAEGSRTKGLSFFKPYCDTPWIFQGTGSMGDYTCERRFERILGGKFVRMEVLWQVAKHTYGEVAIFGKTAPGVDSSHKGLCFSSFTTEGKASLGLQVTPEDLSTGGIAFEADMPAGRARMMLWPEGREVLWLTVASRNASGWKPFLEQRLTPG